MTRMLSKAVGAFIILGLLSPNLALADPTTVAVAPVAAPAASTATATDVAAAGPLSDVPLNSWAYDAVDQLAKDGIIKGYPDGTFKGNRPMTRYEAAVLAYRAVDMIEAQITAGKAVEKADIDAANKLIAAFGAELKTVERHVDALQKEADTTRDSLAATDKRLSGQVGSLNAFNKRAYIKINDIYRTFAYGGNVNANCGPGAYSGNGGAIGSYCAVTGGGNTLLPGARTAGYGPVNGTVPPSQSIPNGQHNQGIGMNYFKLTITGTPSENTAFLMEMSATDRPSNVSGQSQGTSICTPSQNFLNGNLSNAALVNCTTALASQANYNDGEPGFSPGFNNLWYQVSVPSSGLYLRAGHVQTNEGPAGGYWLGGDYFWGAMLGITKGPFNAYVGLGVANAAATNLTLDNIPNGSRTFVAEADYSLKVGRGTINLGGMYMNYVGEPSSLWDPSAVLCTGAGGSNRLFANTAAVPFTSCGAGFTPITYANTAPITGAYLGPAANNPTVSGTPAVSFITPGLAVNTPISWVGAHAIFMYGKARLYLGGSMHLGNDPYTGTTWVGNLTGAFVADYGPYKPGRNAGLFTYEVAGTANGFNGLTGNNNYFGGPNIMNSWNTNPSGLFWLTANVRYWTSDSSSIALGYGHYGLLPNTLLPAGGVACPGCVVSGFNQNAGYLELNLGI